MKNRTSPDAPLRRALSRFPLALKRDALPHFLHNAYEEEPVSGNGESQPQTQESQFSTVGGVLVLPVRGMIAPRWEDIGYSDCVVTLLDRFMRTLDEAAADASVLGIVLDISSPGGISWLVPEAAQKIREVSNIKPVRAVANAQAASAAYWLMTAAGKRYVTPSGEVGSVGVWSMHVDESKLLADWGIDITLIFAGEHKVDGNPFEPLSEAARKDMQDSVNACYAAFTGDVARYMGVSVEKVLADFGQGRCLLAVDALAAGMVDEIATLDEVVAKLQAELQPLPDDTEPRAVMPDMERRSADSKPGVMALVSSPNTEDVIGTKSIFGTALRYHSPSSDLGGFREVFEPGAFADSLTADDIRVIWQHDSKFVFGRVQAGTATVTEDAEGLHYTATPPDAQWARDAIESIRRGDVTQNSFAFMIPEPRKTNERWERRSDGVYRIIKSARLFEVGPQTNPAYSDTTVAVRSMRAALAGGEVIDTIDIQPSAPSLERYQDRLKALAATL